MVPVSTTDGARYALARPRTPRADDPSADLRRCRELASLLQSLSPHQRALGLRLHHFSHHNAEGWSRILSVLCLADALENGCLP